jgi:gamma-glutamylcyclotransferase
VLFFGITTGQEHALDEAEGLGHGYRKDEIVVVTFEGTLAAVAYFATVKDPKRRPYDWYKAFVVQGAAENALPAAYIDFIRAVPSQTDPNTARRARNEALLAGISQRAPVTGLPWSRIGRFSWRDQNNGLGNNV